jgi:phosphatidylserine decarboxylase
MSHRGKAGQAGRRILLGSFVFLVCVLVVGFLASLLGTLVTALAGVLVALWLVFAALALFFFRDPDPRVPTGSGLYVSPAHGTVDLIDEAEEPDFVGQRCRRISIFLSVFDVHVQHAPVDGHVSFLRHRPGEFRNALRTDSAQFNEHVMVGLDSDERPGERVVVRLIAGLIARRIVPWVSLGDGVARGGRLSLIQFGSRVDLYLPLDTTVVVRLGDRVRGGETVMARR